MIPDLKAMDPLKVKTASLFEQKSMRGWWPCYADKEGSRVLAVGALPGWGSFIIRFYHLGFLFINRFTPDKIRES